MRCRGLHHVELNVPDYEKNILFYDRMFGWLGYSSFGTLGIEYIGTYYYAFPHSYIGIQPANSQEPYQFEERKTGINHIALHAKGRKEINRFYDEFLLKEGLEVVDSPQEFSLYAPGYYAVFFLDPSGIKWELAHLPLLPSPMAICKWYKLTKKEKDKHPEWKRHPFFESMRKLPRP